MYNLHLSAEQLEFRDTVRAFVEREIRPEALKADRLDACERSVPPAWLRSAASLGLRTLGLSEAHGGAGADTLTTCLVAEELAAADVDLAAALVESARLGDLLFERGMNDAQRERFLPVYTRDDDCHLALGVREADTDEELGIDYHRPMSPRPGLQTRAMRTAEGWMLNGAKPCVANAPIAGLIAVRAATDEGPATFLVPRDAPGLTIRPTEQHPQWFLGVCGDVELRDCRLPASSRLNVTDDRIEAADAVRCALNLGVARAACEAALDYAKLRYQGGRVIIEHQTMGERIARLFIALDAARALVWRAAWAADHPEAVDERSLPDFPLHAALRVHVSESMHKAALDAAEVFGAMGVMRDMPLQKYVQLSSVFLHGEVSNTDARLRVAEAVAGFRRSRS